MSLRIAINGFGRIGRMVFRRAMNDPSLELVAINASYPAETLAHLLKYDTIHGLFDAEITTTNHSLIVNGKEIQLIAERDPLNLPWLRYEIDVVVEATGKFCDRDGASKHLIAGAKKVLITAPGKNEDITVVMGVNESDYNSDEHHIISNASCTTNCLAPVVQVLHKAFGIEQGLMTTVHAYTNDQLNLDNPHRDLRRARACGQSIIPTKTGAAKALGKVIPDLAGRVNGLALRVPTPNVSVVDLVVDLKQDTTVEEVHQKIAKAAKGSLKGILQLCDEPLVSSDFNGNSHSSIIDLASTMMSGKRQLKLIIWYDNEWGYSCRVVDLLHYMKQSMTSKQPETLSI
ncbi:glyceraldehyde-3-phosphate dehydrogenase (NAD+) [Seinonella peptonophila]|uniref:Glyceraldehyde-3-phosphate dehydrogenase n=1 Tax=Seinonella peptonophila TaxID=112248 RepID=A0A1M4W346_9BACL|nr:glyceraldehyde-3-phosphate dehydrogenase [Seinonella peptonophila]SHE75636.1 glyceraldehyde-3-phosphate dehydrogenase (NAD+) [Seinonella peptonophila]